MYTTIPLEGINLPISQDIRSHTRLQISDWHIWLKTRVTMCQIIQMKEDYGPWLYTSAMYGAWNEHSLFCNLLEPAHQNNVRIFTRKGTEIESRINLRRY